MCFYFASGESFDSGKRIFRSINLDIIDTEVVTCSGVVIILYFHTILRIAFSAESNLKEDIVPSTCLSESTFTCGVSLDSIFSTIGIYTHKDEVKVWFCT